MTTDVKLLIVEDDTLILALLQRLFLRLGYSVATCVDGLEALERFGGESFDLLITDVHMPCLDGIALAEAAREIDAGLPVVFVSGSLDDPDVAVLVERELARHVRSDFVRKPFNIPDLMGRVEKMLALRGKAPPLCPAAAH